MFALGVSWGGVNSGGTGPGPLGSEGGDLQAARLHGVSASVSVSPVS